MTSEQYYHLVDHARSLDGVAIYGAGELTLTGDGEPERIRVTPTTPSLMSVLDVQPERGRWFTDAEAVTGAAPVAVLSHGLWVRRYGQSSAVIGRSISLNGVATTVVGVMPPFYAFPDSRVDVWT